MKRFLPLFAALLLVGCDEAPKSQPIPAAPRAELAKRFTVTLEGSFSAGYNNAAREVFTLKDNETGVTYIGITDCALIQLVKKQKEEAADAILDAVGDIAEAIGDAGGE